MRLEAIPFTLFGAAAAFMSMPAAAQDDPNAATAAQTARLNAERDKLKAETEKLTAQADLERARVTALGLPSYQGTTKLNDGAGALEATLLTTPAVLEAGKTIAGKITSSRPAILLGRDDALDFSLPGAMTAELEGLSHQFDALQLSNRGFVPGLVAGITAIAGLIRSESEVSAGQVTISDAELVTAVAANGAGKVVLPASAIAAVQDGTGGFSSPLLKLLNDVAVKDAQAKQERDSLPADKQKARIDAIDAVRKRYDTFFVRITTADTQGIVPVARASRLERLLANSDGVLRVHVEKSGGTLINNKNIATFFGADPVRVSGGLVVSYVLTSPDTGAVTAAGIIQCRTTLARLRRIQDGKAFATLDGEDRPDDAIRVVCS